MSLNDLRQGNEKQRIYLVPMAIFAPAILTIATPFVAFHESWWYLLALPFIWLGSVCSAPNLNLANGCLTYLAMIVGFVLVAFFRPVGLAILFGAMSGFYLSAIEKWIRMRPVDDVK